MENPEGSENGRGMQVAPTSWCHPAHRVHRLFALILMCFLCFGELSDLQYINKQLSICYHDTHGLQRLQSDIHFA